MAVLHGDDARETIIKLTTSHGHTVSAHGRIVVAHVTILSHNFRVKIIH